MSQVFGGYKDLIEEGDLVIIQVSHDDRKTIIVKDGEITQTSKGAIRHNGLIGYKYGKKFAGTVGDVFVLFPTPEIWTLSLPHRTQIIYSHDISLICNELDLRPGSVVLESGTGSGSLTHALARAVSPGGKVHTCEFHGERAKVAKQEFKDHNISDVVSIYLRDVCHPCNSSQSTEIGNSENGFPADTNANAMILDVPKPWLALESAYNTMKSEKKLRFCTFSPCIEQVQKTVVFALQKWGERVRELSTVEFGMKNHNVKKQTLKFAELGLSAVQKEKLLPNLDRSTICGITETVEVSLEGKKEPYQKPKAHPDSEKTDEIHLRAKKMKLSAMETSFSTAVCSPPGRVYGHTGYLTFFSLVPESALPESVKSNFSQS